MQRVTESGGDGVCRELRRRAEENFSPATADLLTDEWRGVASASASVIDSGGRLAVAHRVSGSGVTPVVTVFDPATVTGPATVTTPLGQS